MVKSAEEDVQDALHMASDPPNKKPDAPIGPAIPARFLLPCLRAGV